MLLALAFLGFWSASASAQIYQYTAKDGTAVFTDKLSDLPPAKRAYYLEKERKAKARLEAIRAAQTPAERLKASREAERLRKERQAKARLQAEANRSAFDRLLLKARSEREQEQMEREYWKERIDAAQADLDKALSAYRKAKEEWNSLSVNATFAMFPGQVQRRQELQKQLPELALVVEKANEELTVHLPAEARKAGVPPGWLR